MKQMGLRIKQKREECGLTMEQLGKKLGVNKSTISKWENGAVDSIKRSHLNDLSEVLHTSPEWLMGFEDTQDVKVTYVADGKEPITAIVDINHPSIGSESLKSKRAALYKVALEVKPENIQTAIDILKSLV